MQPPRLIHGSARDLSRLEAESVQTCVTSPPYWGLRQYAGEQREIWGGDADCAHEWHEQRGGEGYAAGQKRKWQHGATRDEEPEGWEKATDQGGFCACGAWYGALGLEPTPELYVEHMVHVFREVKRVLRKDGTLWLNLGDSYAASGRGGNPPESEHQKQRTNRGSVLPAGLHESQRQAGVIGRAWSGPPPGLKQKDLVGIPWMVAFALRADGWYLRSDIIWHKPNPMPESITDRPTKSHEYLFLLSKSQRYYYDSDAIREPHVRLWDGTKPNGNTLSGGSDYTLQAGAPTAHVREDAPIEPNPAGRNKRTVWTIATRPYPGAHFATYPEDLVEPCILAGSAAKACGVCGAPWERVTERTTRFEGGSGKAGRTAEEVNASGKYQGGTDGKNIKLGPVVDVETTGWQPTCAHNDDSGASVVLDPFNGSGTTGRVAVRHGRSYIGVDISEEYLTEQATKRIDRVQHEMGI